MLTHSIDVVDISVAVGCFLSICDIYNFCRVSRVTHRQGIRGGVLLSILCNNCEKRK